MGRLDALRAIVAPKAVAAAAYSPRPRLASTDATYWTAYYAVRWLDLAPGEEPGGRQVGREAHYFVREHGDEAAEREARQRAERLRAEGRAPTVVFEEGNPRGHTPATPPARPRRKRTAPPSSRGRSPLSSGASVGPEHELAEHARGYDHLLEPEGDLLATAFPASIARKLARAPGGWRTLSEHELLELGLSPAERARVEAMQILTRRSFAPLPKTPVVNSAQVAAVYGQRLAGHTREVFLVVALNGRNEVLASVEVATGALHHLAITPAQVLAPVIRAGASSFIMLHNHPSGDPTPSPQDIALTKTHAAVAASVGIPLVDHVIIAGRGGGFRSLLDLGHLS
jgi:DNA repair protein RadC